MDKLKKVLDFILARLMEPTTYAGGGILATAVMAVFPDQHLASAVLGALAAIGALLAIAIPEKKPVVEVASDAHLIRSDTPSIIVPEDTVIIKK